MLKKLPKLLPFLYGLLAILMMAQAIGTYGESIGLFDDAMWDFTPAVAMLRGQPLFVDQEIRIFHEPLPIVSSPYSGALKIWILAPLLKLLGTSPHMILSLNVLFGFAYLLALYWALLPATGRGWASLVFLLPIVDSNFLLTTPLDNGIFLMQYTFISLAIGALLRYLSNSQEKYYRLAWFLNGCLLAQKLTAVPIVASIAAAIAIVAYRQFMVTVKAGQWKHAARRFLVIPAALFLVPLVPHTIYFFKSGFAPLNASIADAPRVPYVEGLKHCFTFFVEMFDGADWFRRITMGSSSGALAPPVLACCGIAVILCAFLMHLVLPACREKGRYVLVCLGVTAGSFLLYPTVRGLDRPWHYYVLAPPFFCGAVAAAAHCAACLRNRLRKSAGVILAMFCAAAACGVILGGMHGVRLLKGIRASGGVCQDSPAINDLYGIVGSSNIRKVYAVNYSLAYPIYVFSRGTIQTENLAWTKLTSEEVNELFRKIRSDPGAAIAYRSCGDKSVEPDWIAWLNREPDIQNLVEKLASEAANVQVNRCHDARQTEFFLIRR